MVLLVITEPVVHLSSHNSVMRMINDVAHVTNMHRDTDTHTHSHTNTRTMLHTGHTKCVYVI